MWLFKSLSIDTDTQWEFIDGRYVKAHQHGTGNAFIPMWRKNALSGSGSMIRTRHNIR